MTKLIIFHIGELDTYDDGWDESINLLESTLTLASSTCVCYFAVGDII